MAGIGFELQKILREDRISSFFKVALAGMIIVAGPWLLSIISLFLINKLASSALKEGQQLFMSVIIYSYAFSLFLFGGTHYIFTRFLADLIYEDKKKEAGSSLLLFICFIFIIASAVSLPVLISIKSSYLTHPLLFKLSSWLFFIITNFLWVLMIFISLLKKYLKIFFSFLIGMFFSIGGVLLGGKLYGLGGAMLGFTLGQTVTALILTILVIIHYRPGRLLWAVKEIWGYFPKYFYLFLSGICYYWAIWIDKIIFWFFLGKKIPGTPFKLFDTYDIPTYIANLAMIPGLIYFIVITETDFYFYLMQFLKSLANNPLKQILEKKYQLLRNMKTSLREQTIFQAILTIVLLLLAPYISQFIFQNTLNIAILRITFSAIFSHFLFLTLMIFLFYLQLYKYAFFSAFLYLLLNLLLSFVTVYNKTTFLPGMSYLISSLLACTLAGVLLSSGTKQIERRMYSLYS
jgi:uncharacterized membrane protein